MGSMTATGPAMTSQVSDCGNVMEPHRWLDLDGPFPLDPPLTLTQIRKSAPALRTLLDTLRSDHPGSLYFPFSFYGGTAPRPQQPYLNKLPVEFVELFPPLGEAAELTSPGADHQGGVTTPPTHLATSVSM